MLPLTLIPINSLVWSVGSVACFILGIRSLSGYRKSSNQLTKYIAWFSLAIAVGQATMGLPSFFTLNPGILRAGYLGGLLFIYLAFIAQGAVVWCLMLRKYIPVYVVTIPVAIIGLSSWLYALPSTSLSISHHFITYVVPSYTSIVLGLLLVGLFVSVGIYFLLAASSQSELKARLTPVALSIVYLGVGIVIGGLELFTGQVINRSSITVDLVLTIILLGVAAWPQSTKIKS